ncbi:ABC transporter permease [Carnobacterium maltaromaticum]|nr:ABC-2 family transporter protein [Carnobacterium maltaromaticum]CAD5897335.1 ABC transporter permease [Carnobacterium maltaromaticum]
MRNIKRILFMERIFISQDLKRVMEYKGDFFIGILGVSLTQLTNIFFLNIIFSTIPLLDGWSFKQILFIYGFSLIPKGLDHLLFDNLWLVGYSLVRNGEFDKYLTRPLNPLFHVLVEKFQIDALGELLIGIIFLASSIESVNITWSIVTIVLFIIGIICSTAIYTSVKIATAALAFWFKTSGHVIFMIYMLNDFAKYPTTIYNKIIRWTISYIIPFAFTAYYPARYFLTGENVLFNVGGLVVVSTIFLSGSIMIWNKGIKAYESAGS